MKTTLTIEFVDHKAKPTNKPQTDYYDVLVPGLALRVSKAGRKTWTFTYSPPDQKGARNRINIGTYLKTPEGQVIGMSLAAARIKANELREDVKAGRDPSVAVLTVDPQADMTVTEVIEDYLNREIKPHTNEKGVLIREGKRSHAEIERVYRSNIVPVIGSMLVRDVRLRHLNLVLDPIKDRGKLRMVGVTGHHMKTLFKYAQLREYIITNPLRDVQVAGGWKVRDRNLSPDEMKTVWNLLPDVFKRCPATALVVKLIMLTGVRACEAIEAPWKEIDLAKRVWTINKSRVKNGEDFELFLSDEAVAVLREIRKLSNHDWLFPNEDGDSHDAYYNINQNISRAQEPSADAPLGKFGIAVWHLHDLRRTLATQLTEEDNDLDCVEFDASLLLNHESEVKRGITGKYNKNKYVKRKKRNWEKWGAFVAKIVGGNVTELREAA
jgi:integrase